MLALLCLKSMCTRLPNYYCTNDSPDFAIVFSGYTRPFKLGSKETSDAVVDTYGEATNYHLLTTRVNLTLLVCLVLVRRMSSPAIYQPNVTNTHMVIVVTMSYHLVIGYLVQSM
jgi:hypothetical protein